MTVEVNVYEAKTHLSRLLERAAAGERVVISRAGKPIADLVPHVTREVTVGSMRGEFDYDDTSFVWPDTDIADMFYGADDSA